MSVSTNRRDGLAVVMVAGDIDLGTGDRLEQEIAAVTDTAGTTTIVVDLSEVSFLDSTGIGILVHGRRIADAAGQEYRITGARDVVLQVLKITGVWSYLSEGRVS